MRLIISLIFFFPFYAFSQFSNDFNAFALKSIGPSVPSRFILSPNTTPATFSFLRQGYEYSGKAFPESHISLAYYFDFSSKRYLGKEPKQHFLIQEVYVSSEMFEDYQFWFGFRDWSFHSDSVLSYIYDRSPFEEKMFGLGFSHSIWDISFSLHKEIIFDGDIGDSNLYEFHGLKAGVDAADSLCFSASARMNLFLPKSQKIIPLFSIKYLNQAPNISFKEAEGETIGKTQKFSSVIGFRFTHPYSLFYKGQVDFWIETTPVVSLPASLRHPIPLLVSTRTTPFEVNSIIGLKEASVFSLAENLSLQLGFKWQNMTYRNKNKLFNRNQVSFNRNIGEIFLSPRFSLLQFFETGVEARFYTYDKTFFEDDKKVWSVSLVNIFGSLGEKRKKEVSLLINAAHVSGAKKINWNFSLGWNSRI